MILVVGVSWSMTQMTSAADKVALVQTALGLPMILISVLTGAVADVHDRRVVALVASGIGLCGATALTVLAALGLLTVNLLLALCFAVGCGGALMLPAWQSAVSEQVPPQALPAAVALYSISYNIARSVGPAVGGLVVATAGTISAFALYVLCSLPLIAALYLWNRTTERSRLPPEDLSRAMISGVRFVIHSPRLKTVLTRSVITGIIGGSIVGLMPVVATDLLHGGAKTYGFMFSGFGIGAVLGGLSVTRVRKRLSTEAALRACALSMGASMCIVALSRVALVTGIALFAVGAAWAIAWSLFGLTVQMSVPRWVVGRSVAAYEAAASGGIAIGSWAWGHVALTYGVDASLLAAGALMAASPILSAWFTIPPTLPGSEETQLVEDPEVRVPISGRDGPVVVQVEYKVQGQDAPHFLRLMHEVQLSRQRNGAYSWSIARDVSDPETWVERFQCPTWHDYLRHRNRSTQAEIALARQISGLHLGPGIARVRRMIEQSV
jgi:MFS family permease